MKKLENGPRPQKKKISVKGDGFLALKGTIHSSHDRGTLGNALKKLNTS